VGSNLFTRAGAGARCAPKLFERFFTVDHIAALNVVKSINDHPVDLFRAVFLTKIASQDVVIDSLIEKLARIG
jgi:hypothetical protein